MVVNVLKDLHKEYTDGLKFADPRVRDWFLLNNSPVYVIALTFAYLAFIFFGNRYMRNRPAFEIRWVLIAYNFFLVGLSLYMVVEMLLSTSAVGYNYICQPYNQYTKDDPKELRVASVMWLCFVSKAIEYMDTVLMVLRKKTGQITFLHVFHHASMLNIWWWVMMFTPGGNSVPGPLMNCIVHVVMYSYYFLSCFPSLSKKLWWKKYLTILQLVQFVLIFCHTCNTYTSGCDYPLWGIKMLSTYSVMMLILFGNFYLHAYLSKKKKSIENGVRKDAGDGNEKKLS